MEHSAFLKHSVKRQLSYYLNSFRHRYARLPNELRLSRRTVVTLCLEGGIVSPSFENLHFYGIPVVIYDNF